MKRLLCSVLIVLATAGSAHAALITFSTVVDISSCPNLPPGHCNLNTLMPAETMGVGDTVDITVTFAGSQRLVVFDDNGGNETFHGWLDRTVIPNSSSFTISSASITPLGLLGTLLTPLTLASQSSGMAHIGPAIFANFIGTGDNISFTGYRVQFTIDALSTNPNTYQSNWMIVQADRLQVVTTVVPEPASLTLVGLGLVGLYGRRRLSDWKTSVGQNAD